MNTTVEKMFEELGRLHIQTQQQATYIAQLEAMVKSFQAAAPVAPPANPTAA
jgi:hypothetical protein